MVNEENSRKGNAKMSLELEKSENGKKVIDFINRRKINGYSVAREYTVLAEMRNFISKVNKPFESVTETDIINYCATLTGKESTKTTKKTVLKAFFRSINKEDIVSFISTKMTPCDIKANDLLTEDEIKSMISLAQQVKYKAIISLLSESNCRIGEILNLRIKDLEFEKDCARITVKNEKSQGTRTIVLFDSRFYIEKYLKEEHTDPLNRESFVFHMKHPIDLFKKLSADSINNTLQMLGRQANIDKHIHCHLFRHSGCTRDIKKGYNEAQIRFKNGWSASSKMPARYTHLCNSDTENFERIDIEEISGRDLELYRPILALALTLDENIYDSIVTMALEKIKKSEELELENIECGVISCLAELYTSDDWMPVKDLTDRMKQDPMWDTINIRSIGKVMRRLNFPHQRRMNGTFYYVSKDNILDKSRRYGIKIERFGKEMEENPDIYKDAKEIVGS